MDLFILFIIKVFIKKKKEREGDGELLRQTLEISPPRIPWIILNFFYEQFSTTSSQECGEVLGDFSLSGKKKLIAP